MGPISKAWCDEHGDYWSGGRIDIRGVPDEPWGLEYGLSLMHREDWNALSNFLDRFESKKVIPYDTLIMLFEAYYGKKIRWWKDDNEL